MASIKEIAKLAQVSLSTASTVLNGKGDQLRISPKTQQRILEAARQMDYRPNISARRLRSSGDTVSPIIALFWTLDARAAMIAPFLQGVQVAMQSLDTEHEFLIQPFDGSHLKDVKSLLTGTRYNGAIITNATEEDEKYLDQADLKVPIVLYHRSSEKYCFVNADNYHTGQEVARLFASRGHTRAGLIVPHISSSAIRLRKEGFLHASQQLGIEVKEESIVEGDFSEEGGYQATKVLLQSGQLPAALFAASDQMAVGALKALRENGIRVPHDLELLGHGDYQEARFTEPALSTVHLPIEQMAGTCVHMLVDLMKHNLDTPISNIFNTNFVIRETCGGFIEH